MRIRTAVLTSLVLATLMAGSWTSSLAQDDTVDDRLEVAEPEGGGITAAGLPVPGEPDTVRTNIWLVQALMAEIISSTTTVLPPPPAAIQLQQSGDKTRGNLFRTAASRILGGLGYELYQGDNDPARQAAVDYVYRYNVEAIDLKYPAEGRTLGLWRSWIAREMAVLVYVEISEFDSGRILLSEKIERRFDDRVPDDDFGDVDSGLYPFTTAETGQGAWRRRLEAIVVLGALAGLVAVYFANTSN